jgi:hypothetical protein
MLKVPEQKEELLDWCRSVIEDGKNIRRGAETKWWEQISIYGGDLWVEFNPHSKMLEELPKPEHRSRLAINLVSPIVRTEYAKLLKNRPIINCIPRSPDKSDLDAAKTGDKVLSKYIEKQFDMPAVRREALMWCLVTGLGAIFTDYDESSKGQVDVLVDPSGNPIFDPAMIKAVQKHYRDKHKKPTTKTMPQGDLRMRALGPMQWGWDFSTNNPKQSSFQYVSEVYDATVVKRRWGVEPEISKSVAPNLIEQRLLESVDLTGSIKGANVTLESMDLVVVHRIFIQPGHAFFPDGAEIIFTDDELLEATTYPFGHGLLPISSMGHIPMPGARHPISVTSQIRDPVLEISKTESQLLDNRNLMGNPPWLEFDQHAIPEGALVNKPGMRIKIPYRPNVPEPHPIEMPEMPGYIQELPALLEQHVQTIAGQGETSQGRVPPGARSGVAIAYLQEEDDTKLGPTVSEYEEMMERTAWLQLRTIAERYDIPRVVTITRKHSHPEVFDFVGTMLAGVTGVECQAGSALPRSKAAKQQYILDLFSMGIEQDTRKVKEMLELGEGEPEEFELHIEQAERENELMERGRPAPIKDWFNHEAHIATHRRFMLSADYEALPPNIQKVFDDHDALHQRFLTGVAEAQMTGVPTPGQTLPQPSLQNGQTNQAPVQGGPLAQNGQVAATSLMDAPPQ